MQRIIIFVSILVLERVVAFSPNGWIMHSTEKLHHSRGSCPSCLMQGKYDKDDRSVDAFGEAEVDTTTWVIRKVLDTMKNSDLIDEKHAEHCASPAVTHLFKGTPLVGLSDELKLKFVNSWAGESLATIMAEEQSYLGEWKIEKILEAAGEYDAERVGDRIRSDVNSNSVVIYSFVDCPWCIAAKELLSSKPYDQSLTTVIELEDYGLEGKHIRAQLSKMTGRTSMPCIFVNGKAVGGFTDGDPCGPGIKTLHESGELANMIKVS
jgi:glutaredoxin